MATVQHSHLEDYVNGTGVDSGGYGEEDYTPSIALLFALCVGGVVVLHLLGFRGMVAVGRSS